MIIRAQNDSIAQNSRRKKRFLDFRFFNQSSARIESSGKLDKSMKEKTKSLFVKKSFKVNLILEHFVELEQKIANYNCISNLN